MPKMGSDARQARRDQFIGALRRCAALKGYRSLTVDDVCAEAGLSKGAFYTHFDSKQALLVALLEDDAATTEAEITAISDAPLSDLDRAGRFLRAVVARAEDPAEVQMRADLWSEMLADKAVRVDLADVVRRRRQRLAAWIEAGVASGEMVDVPANALAAILVALADGLMLHRALDPSGFRWQNIRRAVDVVLGGLRG